MCFNFFRKFHLNMSWNTNICRNQETVFCHVFVFQYAKINNNNLISLLIVETCHEYGKDWFWISCKDLFMYAKMFLLQCIITLHFQVWIHIDTNYIIIVTQHLSFNLEWSFFLIRNRSCYKIVPWYCLLFFIAIQINNHDHFVDNIHTHETGIWSIV